MQSYLLVAILTFMDGSVGPNLPIENFSSFQACDERARNGWDLVQKIDGEWTAYMNETGDIRPIAQIGLTCVEGNQGT